MNQSLAALALFLLAASIEAAAASGPVRPKGVELTALTWVEAQSLLTPEAVVVLPLGAAAKEHGPHLRLSNDLLIAEYLEKQILERSRVIVAPTLNYGFYPAFLEYPGSTSLRLSTSRDTIVDICRSLARHGPRRFYVVNTGVSTLRALEPAAAALAREGVLLHYTDIIKATAAVEKLVKKQAGRGTHADEIETSMMLFIAPAAVDMRKAVKDGVEKGPGTLTRDADKSGVYSPSGVYGDATLATLEKGKQLTEALLEAVLAEIEALRRAPLPAAEARPLPDESLVGEYRLADDDVITISREGEVLVYERSGRPRVRLRRNRPAASRIPLELSCSSCATSRA
jgi:creatinine amidohydrolase